jgi:hypothetical protein
MPPYFALLDMVAIELARHPECDDNLKAQAALCKKYGFYLDCCTADERKYINILMHEHRGEELC